MRGHTGRRWIGIGLAGVLALSGNAPLTSAAPVDDPATAALRELQAELDALFAPDTASDTSVDDGSSSGWLTPQQTQLPLMAGTGPAGAPVAVTSVQLVENNATVTIDWDDVLGIGAFQVLRDGVVLDESDGTTPFVDNVAGGQTYEYEVIALDPGLGDPSVGLATVAVAEASRGCDFTWTGAVDSEFADADNWAPIGVAPEAPRTPKDGDHICIDVRDNTPATSTDVGAAVGSASTTLDADKDLAPLLDVAGGDFTVSTSFDQVDLAVTSGVFTSTGNTDFRQLAVTDGELAVTGAVSAPGGVRFGPGSPVVSSADGAPVVFDVSPPGAVITVGATLTDAALTLDGPVQLGKSGDRIELDGTSSIVPGAAGSGIEASFVNANSGVAQVDVSMSSSMIVDEGAALTVTDHQAFADETFPPQIAVGGTLSLTQPTGRLGNVDYRSAAAQILLNGGPANDFTGLTSINDMTINEASNIRVRNDLTIRSLSMNNGATFTVDGELDYTGFLSLSDATITAPTVVTTGTGPADGDIDVFGTANRIVGDITTGGTIRLNSDGETNADAKLTIDGDLTLGPDSFIDTNLTGSDVTGRLAIRDAVALDGELLARVSGVIPADTDVAAISWGSATGTLGLTLSGNTTDTTIEQKAGGVFVRRAGGSGLDITAVVALGMLADPEFGVQLQLAWPVLADADAYQIFVDDKFVDEVTDTSTVVELSESEGGDAVTFQVIASEGEGEVDLGTLTIVIPDNECSISWTGAIDDTWETPLNWLPVGEEGLPSPRVPDASDDVCIDIDTNSPILIDGDVSVETISSALPPAPNALIEVQSGEVSAGTSIAVPSLTVASGSVTTESLIADELTLGNGIVDATTSDLAALVVRALGVEVNDAELLGAATIGAVRQSADTTLRIEDLRSPGTAVLDTAGDMTLDTPVAELAELYLFEDGTVSVAGGLGNVFDGLTTIGILGAQFTALDLPESVTIGDLLVAETELVAGSDLTVTGLWSLQDGAMVDVAGDLTLGPDSNVDVASVKGDALTEVFIVGGANLDGTLTIDIAEPVTALPFIEWSASAGSFDSTSLTGAGAANTELIVGATGISIEPVFTGPDVLSVLGFDVGDGLGDVDLLLSWPEFDGADSYAVLRNDELATEVTTLFADVTTDAKQTDTWRVIALDSGASELGDVGSLDVLADVSGCDVVWTGAISDAWEDPLNWAPVVSGAGLPLQAVPAALELACVYVDENLPVLVTTDVEVGGFFSFDQSTFGVGLADDVVALDVADAEFAAIELTTTNVVARNATLDLGGTSELSGDLTLDGSTVELAADLAVLGQMTVVGGQSILDADPEASVAVRADVLTATDATLVIDAVITVDARRVELADGIVGGASVFTADELVAITGESAVAGDGTSFLEATVDPGARLIAEIGGLSDTSFVVRGRLDLTNPGKTLGGLTVEGADAEVVVNDLNVNVVSEITEIGELFIDDSRLEVDAALTTRRLQLLDGELAISDRLDTAEILSLGVSRVEAPVVALILDPEGIFDPRIITGTSVADSELTIVGDLALRADSDISIGLDAIPTTPLITVAGGVTLAGDVNVSVDAAAPAGLETTLFSWFGTATGATTNQLFGANAGEVNLEARPNSIVLSSIVPAAPQLVAYGIELAERTDDPALVSLTWPPLAGATSYGILRAGDVVATTGATSAVVSAPLLEVSEFEVIGIDDGKPLGSLGVVSVFESSSGCDITWTGAIDDDWDQRLNWTPVVFFGEPFPPMRAPSADDSVCVAVDDNLPIQVDADATVSSLKTIGDDIGEVGPDDVAVAVNGAELTVTVLALLSSATVTDGVLRVGVGGVVGDVTLDDGTFEFADRSFPIRGTLTSTGPGDQVIATLDEPSELSIGEVVVDTADLDFDGNIAPIIERVQLDDGFLQGGTSSNITTLVASSGISTLALTGLSVGSIEVAAPAALNIPVSNRFDDTEFAVTGRLNLPGGVESIGRLDLAATGAITINGSRDNVLPGVSLIGDVVITDNTLAVTNPLTAPFVALDDATLSVSGVLSTTNVLAVGTSRINAATTTLAAAMNLSPSLTSVVDGPGSLTIAGDLVLASDARLTLVLDALPTGPVIDVSGVAALGGDAVVSIGETPGDGVELAIIRWASATGTITTTLEGDGASDKASLVQRDTGLFLTSGDVAECGDAPRFADMDVEGCWVDGGDGTFTADRSDNVDGVAIGGVELDIPDDETIVVIDPSQAQISTRNSDGEPVAVPISVPVTDGTDVLATLSLGTFAFDGFQIGSSISIALGDLFGFPIAGTPELGSSTSGWSFSLNLDLSGILRTAGALDLSIGSGGILSSDLSLDDLSAVFGDLAGIASLDIDWTDASTWLFDGGGLGGPSITGDIDFNELDGGGTLTVRDLRVEDTLVLPDFDLTGVFTDTTRTWAVSQPPSSVLRSFGFGYTTDGALISGEILLGDVVGENLRDSVATWGEWLDIDTFELVWADATKQWDINGRLASPDVAFTGLYVGDGDGGTERFELDIDGTELGPFATVDLDLAYIDDTNGERFAVTAQITRDGAPDIDGQGVFTFEQGDLATAQVTFDELVIGELLTIDDFRVTWNERQGRFTVDGQLTAPDGATNEVTGSLTFDDGRLLEGDLQLDSLTIGPIRFDEFSFDFARTPADADERITTASMSGEVRVGTREPTSVTGEIRFVDGEINEFGLVVGVVDLGGIAQIDDLTLEYTTNEVAGTATVSGTGQLVTSDGATDTPVLVELTLRDGQVVDGRIEADVLRFGRLLTIENLELVDSPIAPGACTDLPAPDGAQQWQVTGETTSNGETTSIDGCLVLDGSRLVAGELELGNVRLGSLLTIDGLRASFAQQTGVEVTTDDGETVTINQTDMLLSATVTVGDNDPASFSGSASFANGGLTAFELSLPDLDLMNVVRLRDVEFAYTGDTPWDDRDEASYRLRGDVVGENTTSSFDGEVLFGADGEVTALSIDAEEVDFGLFRIDALSFAYSRDGDGSEWAISGAVEVDGETTTITGAALFEDGRIVEASLDIENLVIADLVVVDDVTLDYLRDPDGSEAWLGSAAVTIDDKSNAVSLGFAFDGDGRLVFGSVEVARLKWSELLVFENVSFTYETEDGKTRWDVSGDINLDRETTTLDGFLELEAGRATAGVLVITNLRIGELTTIRSLTLAADTSGAVTTWAAAIAFDNDANTTGSGSLTWTEGRLTAAQLELADVRFGPTFALENASLSFTEERWALSATLENAGDSNSISFELEFDDGRLVAAEFSLTQLKFGDVLSIDDFTISYAKTATGASWSGSATVQVGDRVTSVAMSFDFVDGRLITAEITIGQLRWSEAIVLDDVVLTFDRSTSLTRWTLTGGIIIDGETTSLSGYLTLDDGRLIGGNLNIQNLGVGALTTIEELDLTYVADDEGARFTADIIFTNGASASGSMTWSDGRLDRASLELDDIDLGPTFTLNDAVMSYSAGTWSFEATFNSDGNGSTISGSLIFRDGRLVDGTLSASDIRIAGLALSDFALVLGDRVNVGGGNEAVADICGVTDPGGPGDVYGIIAGFVNDSGSVGTIAGRLRSDDGRITDGVLCATDLSVAGMLVIDEFLLQPTTVVIGDQVQETWAGSVALRNPESPDDPFTGDFEWVSRNGTTTSVEIAVGQLRFSDLITLEDVTFDYGKTPTGSTWAIGASLQRPGTNPSVSGSIDFTDGAFAGAELTITNLSFGNVVSLDDFTMTYVGRRAVSTLPDQQFDNDGVFPSLPVGGCDQVPDGVNVPSGPPSTTGAEAYFRIDAQVSVGPSTVAAAGSIGMVDGKMSMFDVSIACLNIVDWISLEDIRIGLSDDGDYLFQAEQGDATESNQRVTGRINMGDGGKVSGGRLSISNLSLGFVELQYLRLALGQQDDGTSEWGAEVAIYDPSGDSSLTSGGSVQLNDGKIVGGSIDLGDLPLLDLLPVRNAGLGFERLDNGNLRVSGSATLTDAGGSDAGVIDLLLVYGGGSLLAGSIQADDIELFNVIKGGSFSVTYDRNAPGGPRWSGELNTDVPGQSGASIAMAIEVVNGRVDSGILGFDGNGDGQVDPTFFGSPPASGNGELGGFPLKALYVRYCAEDTVAIFCDDAEGREWDGRLKVELPTANSPSLSAAVTIRDGRFVRASLDLSFNPGIMIFAGVFLDSIGASLELDPRLRFCGSLGASVGSTALPIARIEGNFQFSEEFSGLNTPAPPSNCSQPPPQFNVPDGAEADYYRFLIQAEATLFPGNPLGINLRGTGYLDLWTSGYLGLGAEVNANIWTNKLAVNGRVDGSVWKINTFNPLTGERGTSVRTQLSGEVSAVILGANVATASFLVNSRGWTGCAGINLPFGLEGRTGVTGYWQGGFQLGCGLESVAYIVPGGSPGSSNLVRPEETSGMFAASLLSAFTPTADTRFEIDGGESALGLIMRSAVGTPNTLVISPDGTEYDVVNSPANDRANGGPQTFTDGNDQIFIIDNPVAGTWTVRQVPGSPVLESINISLGLPDVDVSADLRQDGTELSIDYSVVEVPGQSVSFVERDANGAVIGQAGVVETPDATASAALVADGVVQLASLTATGTTTGTFTYRSNAAAGGGEHQLVALVDQDGLPRTEIVLATYEVAPASQAAAPTAVTATATSDGASVTWEPPTDDGGRQITAYHVSSVRGFTVAVDGNTRTAELPIPQMTPGETLEVYVQAFTAAGPGASGVATFTATASTGPVYEQPVQPLSFVVGSDPFSPPDDTPVIGPNTVPTPVDPPSVDPPPVDPPAPQPPVTELPATGSGTMAPVTIAMLFLLAGLAFRLAGRRSRRSQRVATRPTNT